MNAKLKSINWTGAGFLILSPIAALILTVYHLKTEGFLWPIWLLAAVFYALTACSITAGYHRYWAHRTYEARGWVKWLLALFGAAAFQNSIYIWAREHRLHHRFVDTDLDPYSISKGFFFAHFGWMLVHPETPLPVEPYGRDLEKDPVVMFQHKYYVPLAILVCFFIPMGIGYLLGSALGGLAIAGFLRVCALHHGTFLINSWCHVFGRQTYTDSNSAKDSFIMAVATFGEGYHNFHHFFDRDYRNGVRWYHWDPTKWIIRTFALMGGAHSLRRTPWPAIIKAQMLMDEKRLKSKLKNNWQTQFQQQLDNLKVQVETANLRFEHLREEYRKLVKDYREVSMERLQELKRQIRAAKAEFRAALKQWREYNSMLLKNAYA